MTVAGVELGENGSGAMKKIKVRKLPEVKRPRELGAEIVLNEQPPSKKDLSELNRGWPKSLVAEGKKGLL